MPLGRSPSVFCRPQVRLSVKPMTPCSSLQVQRSIPAAARLTRHTNNRVYPVCKAAGRQPRLLPAVTIYLEGVEMLAITVAAATQACLLVANARLPLSQVVQDKEQRTGASKAAAQVRSIKPAWLSCLTQREPVMSIQGFAVVIAIMCNICIRWMSRSNLASSVSLQAAARLARLEAQQQQSTSQLNSTAQQLQKLNSRVQLSSSRIKGPLQQTQSAAVQQAEALVKLADQHTSLTKQVEGLQELLAALQAVQAKQFKVSAEALQRLQSGQQKLEQGKAPALSTLKQQQQQLHTSLKGIQQQLAKLEAANREMMQKLQQQEEQQQQPQQQRGGREAQPAELGHGGSRKAAAVAGSSAEVGSSSSHGPTSSSGRSSGGGLGTEQGCAQSTGRSGGLGATKGGAAAEAEGAMGSVSRAQLPLPEDPWAQYKR